METWIVVGVIVLIGVVLYFRMPKASTSSDDTARENKMLLESKIRLESELRSSNEKVSRLESEVKKESEEKHKVQGENKRLAVNNEELSRKNDLYLERGKELHNKVVQFESVEEKMKKDFDKKITELEESRKALEDEKARIRKEDENKQLKEESERDRIWNEHENESIAHMKSVCQKPELAFTFYENTSLPDTFDGTLKPDFLVEFLGQYIIFDAKMSKSNDLQTYISNQVKSTVKKVKESNNTSEIYSNIFFIVPDMDFVSLKKSSYYEDGYSCFVITKHSFEAIMCAYRKVCDYDLAESFDPQERENIVNLIATYDHHISKQNAINILSSAEGVKVSMKKSSLNKELLEDIENKKGKIRVENFKPTDLKRLIQNPSEQIKEIIELVRPSDPVIKHGDLEDASESLL